jgi:hypothetical protein
VLVGLLWNSLMFEILLQLNCLCCSWATCCIKFIISSVLPIAKCRSSILLRFNSCIISVPRNLRPK